MRYFRDLIEQSLNRTREATLGVLGVNHQGLRHHLSEQMVNELGAEGCFLAPPVFEHTFGWEEADVTLQDLQSGLLSESLLNTLHYAENYAFSKDSRPYKHQLKAWNVLTSEPPRSAIITSGTGSGKTECFMVPILNDLVEEVTRTRVPLVGVRALFLYPLNALINSQQERLDAWTRPYGDKIRFCLYNGKTEESASIMRKEQSEKPNQVLSRELLRKEPAPILMTNATMLEYMLVRQVDSPILAISQQQESLRWIVLDEAHTYVGSQAAEISLLLRRVVQAFGRRADQIRFVATSATIAGDDTQKQLQKYLADLAGVSPDQVDVISGSRVWPDVVDLITGENTSLDELLDIEPDREVSPARFEALTRNYLACNLRHAVVSSPRPLDLNELIQAVAPWLRGKTNLERQQEVLAWLDLMTGTFESDDQPPFLKLRTHLFQRMLHGLWACVNPECSAKSEHLTDWPLGNVYVNQRSHCDCHAPVYELGFCAECRTPHLEAEDRNGVLRQKSPYVDDEFSLSYESDGDEAAGGNGPAKVLTQGFVLARNNHRKAPYMPLTLDLDTQQLGLVGQGNCIELSVVEDKRAECSHCTYSGYEGDFLRKAYLGAPFYVANAVPTVLEFCQDPDKADCDGLSPEELPGRGRKLITFTDSRQGTARMAVKMQQEAERSRLRGLVFETLRNAQVKSNLAQPQSSEGHAKLLAAEMLEKMGQPEAAAEMRREAEQEMQARVLAPVKIEWTDMVRELATTNDIGRSILEYNRYANPMLFSDSQGSVTMARLLLTREFAIPPKTQNSSETLGLVRVDYKGFDSITSPPPRWLDTLAPPATAGGEKSRLTKEDWRDFLKVALDYFVRQNAFLRLERNMQLWMGMKAITKSLFSPKADVEESTTVKKWPQTRAVGNPSRLIKLLELGTRLSRTSPDDASLIDSWLEAAWQALTAAHILEPVDLGHRLKLETLMFSLPTEGWVCPLTHRILGSTFRGLTPYLPRNTVGRDYHCEKIQLPALTDLLVDGSAESRLSQIRSRVTADPVIAELRRESLWSNLCDRVVEGGFYYRTAEHSAQQSAKKLDDYVELFKKGRVNVLNCSTTMEMGVDIGGISAVVMNNVPPHPANYLQRAGRAGRRREARAIAYTLCKADPHNQRAFAEPKWPFVTSIPAPNITLSSARIVQRHVNSLLLSLFLRSSTSNDGDRTKLTLKWFFSPPEDSPCLAFTGWLAVSQKAFADAVRSLVAGTCLEGQPISAIMTNTRNAIRELEARWISEYAKLNAKLQAATDEPYKKALTLERRRHENEYLLRDLAARAFLPGYGFPTDVVSLNTYNIDDFKNQQNERLHARDSSREDNIFSHKDLPSRSLNIAIQEYAPGSQVVIDGRVYRSAGISLHWHAAGQVNEAQKFDVAWRCENCGATGLIENAYTNMDDLKCNCCQASIPSSQIKTVLRPSGFVTDFYEETGNDISSRKMIRVERPRIHLKAEVVALPDKRCGTVRFGHNGAVFYHSSGEHERGYAVCMACGRAESMLPTGEVPKSLRPDQMHRPVGGIGASHKEKDCSGAAVKANLYLGYQIHTDVLELFLKSPATGQWLGDSPTEQTIAMTLAVAIRDEIAEQLGISSDEMGFGFRLDRDLESNQGRSVVQLFDDVSGGAGFVLSAVNDLGGLLKKALARLHCPASCDNVCSHCLAGQDSRVEREELDRKLTQEWLASSGIIAARA
ncbi:DEAD/DEAH box helicase [Azotobacter chroococcum]|uniref:DEAD/DEAH box helicase n=1 Tax=Azotobacter chroococcum NCIMB 8003 TaxID=1328314 RepID=A0A0C4WTA0_9GAMM|nr:DEAD/DEAH box helicase [Azotobacter chroococcum]AJE23874.1 Hypothetical protein Achr_f1800 [Azotobacter chroococcum NCIMB 8003]